MSKFGRDVRFVFTCEEKESAELKIRLRYDGLKQNNFFKSLLRMYIESDPIFIPVLEKIKKQSRSFGKRKILNATKEHKKGAKMLTDFGLTDEEKIQIFDIILSEEDLDE